MTAIVRRTSRWTPLSVAAVVLGFFVWWPVGLATLGYIMWGGSVDEALNDLVAKVREMVSGAAPRATSGNAAFDAYRRETLDRLEREQREFADYLEQLRAARDEEEFKRFMAERDRRPD